MKPPSPVFLERRGYRRRRLLDAARILPVLGVLLFLVPLLWGGTGAGATRTSQAMIYVFVVWAGLVVLAYWLWRVLGPGEPDAAESEARGQGE